MLKMGGRATRQEMATWRVTADPMTRRHKNGRRGSGGHGSPCRSSSVAYERTRSEIAICCLVNVTEDASSMFEEFRTFPLRSRMETV